MTNPSMDVNNASVGDMSNAVSDYSVNSIELDSPNGDKEYGYQNTNFAQEMGYMDVIPELASTIKAIAKWTVGKGYKADAKTKAILSRIVGNGKQSFNEVIKNSCKGYQANGDSFCEIIRDKTIKDKVQNIGNKLTLGLIRYAPGSGTLLNLKPLNGGKVKIIADASGMINRYEYNMGVGKDPQKFKPNEMFHLAWDVIGDQTHGTSLIRRLENIILMRNEAMADQKIVFHRYVKPLWIFSLNTDNPTKIAAAKAKFDQTTNKSENMFIPMKSVEAQSLSVPQYSTLDPLPWIDALNSYFYQATNVPDVILGSAKQTVEASAKMLVWAFEQSVEEHQLFLEEQIKLQLGLEVNFEFPNSIAQDVIATENKEGGKKGVEPNDTKVELEGKK